MNNGTREMMGIFHTIFIYVRFKYLNCCGHSLKTGKLRYKFMNKNSKVYETRMLRKR